MKILLVADLHADHEWFDWVANQAPQFDVIVIAGDLQNAFSNTSLQDQARAIGDWLVAIDCSTIVCSGNHDYWIGYKRESVELYAKGAWLKHLRHKGRVIGVDGDTFHFPVADSGERVKFTVNGWLDVPKLEADTDILVTHAPPMGCACATGAEGNDVGDPELWQGPDQPLPKLILSGHVHRPVQYSSWWPPVSPKTLVLVPGCDDHSPVPNHWIIDTGLGQAKHSDGSIVSLRWP